MGLVAINVENSVRSKQANSKTMVQVASRFETLLTENSAKIRLRCKSTEAVALLALPISVYAIRV